jgi:hypothetical protein
MNHFRSRALSRFRSQFPLSAYKIDNLAIVQRYQNLFAHGRETLRKRPAAADLNFSNGLHCNGMGNRREDSPIPAGRESKLAVPSPGNGS